MPSRVRHFLERAIAVAGYVVAVAGFALGAVELGRASIRLISYESVLAQVVFPVSVYGLETHQDSYAVRYEFQAAGQTYSGAGSVPNMSVMGDPVRVLYKRRDPAVNFVHDTSAIFLKGALCVSAGAVVFMLIRRRCDSVGRNEHAHAA